MKKYFIVIFIFIALTFCSCGRILFEYEPGDTVILKNADTVTITAREINSGYFYTVNKQKQIISVDPNFIIKKIGK